MIVHNLYCKNVIILNNLFFFDDCLLKKYYLAKFYVIINIYKIKKKHKIIKRINKSNYLDILVLYGLKELLNIYRKVYDDNDTDILMDMCDSISNRNVILEKLFSELNIIYFKFYFYIFKSFLVGDFVFYKGRKYRIKSISLSKTIHILF